MRSVTGLILYLGLFGSFLAGCASQSQSPVRSDDSAMHLKMAGQAYTEGRCDDAIEHYLEVIKVMPKDHDSRLRIANCVYRKGDVTDAIEHYKRILLLDPTYASAWYNLSYIQLEELAVTLNTIVETYSIESENNKKLVDRARLLLNAYDELDQSSKIVR